MKLLRACEIANNCGLTTVGQAVMNVKIHAASMFTYDELDSELKELMDEAASYNKETLIYDVLQTQLAGARVPPDMYTYLMDMAADTSDSFPFTAKNADGDDVLVEHDSDENGEFIRTSVKSSDGWTRVNTYYKNGETTLDEYGPAEK